ncbi:MAG: hypothetical protein ABJ246_07810 [Paracoccaceae bacterium]
MSYPTKIATCCYCGTRAALVLKGKIRHELACGSCGAPLHDLKMLPKDKVVDRERGTPSVQRKPISGTYRPDRKKKRKPRKGWMRDLLEEAVDLIEDVFD